MDPLWCQLESIDRQIKADIESIQCGLRSTVEVEKRCRERSSRGPTRAARDRRCRPAPVRTRNLVRGGRMAIAMVADSALFETLDGDGDGLVTSQNETRDSRRIGSRVQELVVARWRRLKAFKRIDADKGASVGKFVVARASHARAGQ